MEIKEKTAEEVAKEKRAEEQLERALALLEEVKKEGKPLTGPQMVLVEARLGISPSEGWGLLEALRQSGEIIKFKTKDSHRAPALYALPEQRPLVDVKKWTFEVK